MCMGSKKRGKINDDQRKHVADKVDMVKFKGTMAKRHIRAYRKQNKKRARYNSIISSPEMVCSFDETCLK